MTPLATADAAGSRLRELASALRRGVGRQAANTAGYNVASNAAADRRGIVVARALGLGMRGEYAAVTAWFGIALMVGGLGQPTALCFDVAHDPRNARSYVATSRAMMLVTGTSALARVILFAPRPGNAELTLAHRIAFATPHAHHALSRLPA
jgi:hypothetical protein